jgi:DNA-binding transcriptional ArsR family regulator
MSAPARSAPVAEKALDVVGDPTRREILRILARGESPVGRIAEALPVSRPAVSKHLRLLRGAGLVVARAEGRRTIYSLDADGLRCAREYFDELWTLALARFRVAAENLEVGE